MKNLKIQNQGKIIVERGEDGIGWLVMFPDGKIRWFADKKKVEKETKTWFAKNADKNKIGLGVTEWMD